MILNQSDVWLKDDGGMSRRNCNRCEGRQMMSYSISTSSFSIDDDAVVDDTMMMIYLLCATTSIETKRR